MKLEKLDYVFIVGVLLLVSGWLSLIWLTGTLFPLIFFVTSTIIFVYTLVIGIKKFFKDRKERIDIDTETEE